jgi:hypothetical protein
MATKKNAASSKRASRKPNPRLVKLAPGFMNYCCTNELAIKFEPGFWDGVTLTPLLVPSGIGGFRLSTPTQADRICITRPTETDFTVTFQRPHKKTASKRAKKRGR